jgi:hypothetical protein
LNSSASATLRAGADRPNSDDPSKVVKPLTAPGRGSTARSLLCAHTRSNPSALHPSLPTPTRASMSQKVTTSTLPGGGLTGGQLRSAASGTTFRSSAAARSMAHASERRHPCARDERRFRHAFHPPPHPIFTPTRPQKSVPPSTFSRAPLTYEARSDKRYAITSANSSCRPARSSATCMLNSRRTNS